MPQKFKQHVYWVQMLWQRRTSQTREPLYNCRLGFGHWLHSARSHAPYVTDVEHTEPRTQVRKQAPVARSASSMMMVDDVRLLSGVVGFLECWWNEMRARFERPKPARDDRSASIPA